MNKNNKKAYLASPPPVFLRDQSLTVLSLLHDMNEFSLSKVSTLLTSPV